MIAKKISTLCIWIMFFGQIISNNQDIIINNEVVQQGTGPDCSIRYQAIQQILNAYKRPLTMLELDAQEGYYSLRLAHDYDATCVMTGDQTYANNILHKLCLLNTDRNNLILLNKKLTDAELTRLGECEHFDVVLLLNPESWQVPSFHLKKYIDIIMELGEMTFCEIPTHNTKLEKQIQFRGGICIATPDAKSKLYLIEKKKSVLKRRNWLAQNWKNSSYAIETDYHKKVLTKRYPDFKMTSEWIKGINLLTFKMLYGSFPTKKTIAQNIDQLALVKTSDWSIHNMIIQGNIIQFIDVEDPRWKRVSWPYSPARKKFILSMIELNDPVQIKKVYFNNVLTGLHFEKKPHRRGFLASSQRISLAQLASNIFNREVIDWYRCA